VRRRSRPRCFLNVAMSLDGKIASSTREAPTFTSQADRRMMDRIRARADAILVGAGTLRAADFPLRIRAPSLRKKRRASGRPEQPLNIVVSSSLEVPLRGRFFSAVDVRRLVVTGRKAPPGRVRQVSAGSEVLFLGKGRVDLPRLMRRLFSLGIRELLLEGGGATNFAFLRDDLVDEIYITLCPIVIGGSRSPTPVDGEGFAPESFKRFRLTESRRSGNELFLHYLLAG